MTKKDYIFFAKLLKGENEQTQFIKDNELASSQGDPRTAMLKEVIAERNRTITHLTREMIEYFQKDNASFDENKFREACIL